jgi:hypothetical protein
MARTDPMMMIEARRAERIRSFLRARIIFNNHQSTIDCVIKNISKTGAKIELDNAMSIPDAFELEVPQKGRTFQARLSWRDRNSIGVAFAEGQVAPTDSARQKLEHLEQENRRLRRDLAQLTSRLEELGQVATLP